MSKLLTVFSLFILFGCGNEYGYRENTAYVQEKAIATSPRGILSISEKNIPEFEINRQKLTSAPKLKKVELKEKFQFEVYQNESVLNEFFVLPRVFFFGGLSTDQRMTRISYGDGFEKLVIPVVLVSGLENQISDYVKNLSLVIPDGFKLKDKKILEEILNEKSESQVDLKKLDGCPDYGMITVDGNSYRGSFSSDYQKCVIGNPLQFEVRMDSNDVEKLVSNEKSDVAFQAYYNFTKSIYHGKRQLDVNLKLLVSGLEAKMGAKIQWSKSEATELLREVIIAEGKGFSKEYEIPYNILTKKLFSQIFVKETDGFALNFNQEIKEFSLEWGNIENIPQETRFALKALPQVSKQSLEYNLTENENFQTSLVVNERDNLEINLNMITALFPKQLEKRVRHNNNVCLKTKRICTSREVLVTRGSMCSEWKEECVHAENQWRDVVEYSINDNHLIKIEPQQLDLGMLTFHFNSDGKHSCRLKDLDYTIQENKLVVKMDNTKDCEIFNENVKEAKLEIQNTFKFSKMLKEGKEIINWKGQKESSAKEVELKAKVQAQLKIAIDGYRLINY